MLHRSSLDFETHAENGEFDNPHIAPETIAASNLAALEHRIYREAAISELSHLKAVFTAVYNFKGECRFVMECAIAAHGFWEILPAKDFTKLAARWHVTKAAVQKLVEKIQKTLNLPPVPGQREANGCHNMRRARRRQLVNGRPTQ